MLLQVAGAGIILVGVCMCVIGAATNVQAPAYHIVIVQSPNDINHLQTEFTPSDVEWRVAQPVGGIYVVFLCGALFASVVAILMFETSYPNVKHPVVPADGSAEAVKLSPKEIQESDKNPDVLQAPEVHAEVRPPPLHLNAIMAVVYPASLGLDEGPNPNPNPNDLTLTLILTITITLTLTITLIGPGRRVPSHDEVRDIYDSELQQ